MQMSALERIHQAHKMRRQRFAMAAKNHLRKHKEQRQDTLNNISHLPDRRFYKIGHKTFTEMHDYPRYGASEIAQIEALKSKKEHLANNGLRRKDGALYHHTIANIKARVARFSGVSVGELESPNRMRRTVYVRDRAIWLCIKYSRKSTTMIAQSFGGRDHSTIIHSYKKIENEKNRIKGVSYETKLFAGPFIVGDLTFHTKKDAVRYLFEKNESIDNIAQLVGSSIRSVKTMRSQYNTEKRMSGHAINAERE